MSEADWLCMYQKLKTETDQNISELRRTVAARDKDLESALSEVFELKYEKKKLDKIVSLSSSILNGLPYDHKVEWPDTQDWIDIIENSEHWSETWCGSRLIKICKFLAHINPASLRDDD